MTYDGARRKVLLFGGADATQVCSDTWEWNGRCWNRLSTTGPGPRTFAALAYDSVRKRVVLFGGNRALFGKTEKDNELLGDTWEWDGQKWLEIKAPGPLPRAEAAMTFGRKRRRVLLFGGYNRSGSKLIRLGDTWEWDGVRWNEVKAPGPSPRSGAAMTWDDERGKAVLFGGQGSSAETWEWDGKQWMAGELDQTAVPAHAWKFTAAMQAAQGCDNAVLLKTMRGAGHNYGGTAEQTVDSYTDELMFLARALRLSPALVAGQ